MTFYGYVTSRKIGPMMIPVPAQNSSLREFVLRHEGNFILPPLESFFDNCFHYLFGLLKRAENKSVIVMYSILMLPEETSKLYKLIYLAEAKNIRFASVLENVIFEDSTTIKKELFTYQLQKYTADKIILFRKYIKGTNYE